MAWWVITKLQTQIDISSLSIQASTNFADHLFMAWAYHKPRRVPIYVRVRGTLKFCGYKYIWDTPFIEEQAQAGDSIIHSFSLAGLQPASTIWFYLHAPGGPYGLEIQGPLMSITLEEAVPDYPWCWLGRITSQSIPNTTWTPIEWTSEYADPHAMHDLITNPTRITAPESGIYVVSAHIQWSYIPASGYRFLALVANSAIAFRRFETNYYTTNDITDPHQALTGQFNLDAGQWVEAYLYHNRGAALTISQKAWSYPVITVSKVNEL